MVLKRVQPVRPPEWGMEMVKSNPPIFKDKEGTYFLKKFETLFECFPSGYIKDKAETKDFSVSYGKASRAVTDQEKKEADVRVETKMKSIFGPNFNFYCQSIRMEVNHDDGISTEQTEEGDDSN